MLHVEALQRRAGAFRLWVEDWRIPPGAYVVVVGPSGAGKTMLLETIAGLHPIQSGRIALDGRDITRLPPERRGVGLVYQHCWLFPHLTVRQNIDFGRRYHRHAGPHADTDQLAEMLRITSLLDRKPEGLSGGERQRVALARALAIRPRLLFLDEPLGTLDPVTREHVASELLKCHRAFGMTTVHVTHDHAEARLVGDTLAVLLDGRMEQSGELDGVFRRPRTPALARFLGCENLLEARVEPAALAGRVLVHVAGTTFETESLCQGRVVFCLRPEDLQIDTPDAPAVPARRQDTGVIQLGRGVIIEASPRGAQVRVLAEAADARWVGLIGSSEWRRQRWRPGDPVALSALAEAIHLLEWEATACG